VTDVRHANKHFIIGIIILGVGVVLLLDQLGLTEANQIFRFWPLILIYFGVQKLISAPNLASRFWGGFITLLGISFQLEALGVRGIRFGTIWPVLLICAGVLMVLKHYERGSAGYYNPPPPPPPASPDPSSPDAAAPDQAPPQAQSFSAEQQQAQQASPAAGPPPPPTYGSPWDRSAWRQQRRWEKFQHRMNRMNNQFNNQWQGTQASWKGGGNWSDSSQPMLDDVYIFWGGRRRILSKNFIGGDIVAIFGGFEIDLTQADFSADQIEIEMVAIFGGGELRVPPNWEVIVENVGIFGGTSDRTWHPNSVPPAASTVAPPAPIKRLIIKGVAIFGGLTIKN
jgi:Domain of unknown function (DUF5668)